MYRPSNDILSLGYWNVKGLNDDKLKNKNVIEFIENNEICFLSETWWNTSLDFTGKRVIKKDALKQKNKKGQNKKGRKSGGLLTFIDNTIRKGVTLLEGKYQYGVWLKLHKSFFKTEHDIFLCGIYIPPKSSPYAQKDIFNIIDTDIAKLEPKGQIVIMGDLNARTGESHADYVTLDKYSAVFPNIKPMPRFNMDKETNSYGKCLLELCKHNDLLIANGRSNGDIPGRVTLIHTQCTSTLDYALLSSPLMSKVLYFKVSDPTYLSDHNHITLKLKVNKQHTIDNTLHFHPIKPGFIWNEISAAQFSSALKSDFCKELRDSFLSKPFPTSQKGINEMGSDLTHLISTIGDMSLKRKRNVSHSKRKKTQNTNKHKDRTYVETKNELKSLWNLLMKYPRDPYIRGKYIHMKKLLQSIVKKLKREQKNILMRKIQEFENNDPKAFWNLISKIRKSHNDDENIDPELLFSHFKQLHQAKSTNTFDKDFEHKIKEKLDKIDKDKVIDILDEPTTVKEVLDVIKLLKNKKASGPDCISNEMIKLCVPQLTEVFVKSINHVLKSEAMPDVWTEGYISAVHKKGDKHDPDNYRGLTISNCIGKIITKLLSKRLLSWLETNNVIEINQIGFLPKRRTSDHLLVLKTIIDLYKKKGKAVYMCFVDLSKAFDTVNHTFLIYKLHKTGLSTKFINVIKSMYTNMQAFVKTKHGYSDTFRVQVGTKQGCNLSPQLFNIFLNDLPNTLSSCNSGFIWLQDMKVRSLMFADDIVLLSETSQGLQKSLSILESYCKKWHLSVNVSKTKIVIFNKKLDKVTSAFRINTKNIDIVKSHTYLGFELSCNGSFKLAIDKLYSKASKAYHILRQHFNFQNTPPKVLSKLFHSMIMPIMTYGSEVWACFGWRKSNLQCIKTYLFSHKHSYERLQAKFCKMTLGIRKTVPDKIAKAEMGIYPVMSNMIKKIFSFWQHALDSPNESLLHKALESSISADRNGHMSYYTRIKDLLSFLDMRQGIYKVQTKHIGKYSKNIQTSFKKLYQKDFFENLITTGRTAVYKKIKHNYRYESYLNHSIKPELRRYISAIRLSAHCLPIESLRSKNIKREERICNLCKNGVGTEWHVMIECTNATLQELRSTLRNKLIQSMPQYREFPLKNIIEMEILAINDKTSYYFANFLKRVFQTVKEVEKIPT